MPRLVLFVHFIRIFCPKSTEKFFRKCSQGTQFGSDLWKVVTSCPNVAWKENIFKWFGYTIIQMVNGNTAFFVSSSKFLPNFAYASTFELLEIMNQKNQYISIIRNDKKGRIALASSPVYMGLRVNVDKTKFMTSGSGLNPLHNSGKYPCGVCRQGVGNNSIECQGCKHWVHWRCSGKRGRCM